MAESINPKVDSPSLSMEVDGEAIYFSPNSAQGKAVQRIHHPIPEDKWVNVEAEGEINMEAVRQRIRQRGYKTQVSAEDQPTGNQ